MELTKEQELLQTVILKAWEDTTFKKELLENPIPTIKNLTGENITLPEGKTLVVRDQTETSIVYINIPAAPNMDDMELNEEQLEIIAGGGELPKVVFQKSADPLNGFLS